MLLVEKGLSASQGSFVLGSVKISALIGTYFGGFSSDRWGLRTTILLSFFLTAIGFSLLPIVDLIVVVTLCGVISQIGHAMFPSAARLMLSEIHGPKRLQEGIAWLRTANNAGQIVSYTVGAVFAFLGTGFFFFVDAATSFLAAAIGYKYLHDPAKKTSKSDLPAKFSTKKLLLAFKGTDPKPKLFVLCTIATTLFSMNYEMVIIGTAAKTKLLYKEDGLTLLSWFMLINTILCTISAVPAARFFHNIKFTFRIGTLLSCLGGIVALSNSPSKDQIFFGAFLITAGEIIFTSMAQYALLLCTPESSNKGVLYSMALLIQKTGGIIAGFISLPLLVYGNYAKYVFSINLIVTFLVAQRFFILLRKSVLIL